MLIKTDKRIFTIEFNDNSTYHAKIQYYTAIPLLTNVSQW